MAEFHPFEEQTLSFIHEHQLIHPDDTILAAVSGGPDSVALLHALLVLHPLLGLRQIRVVHFDHRLRGEDSDEDRRFVEALALSLELPFILGQGDVRAHQKRHRLSLEMAARERRHAFFRKMLDQSRAQKIALGHTANDQAEELFLRLIRGVGPSGLAGMLPKTGRGIIRPLLWAQRRQILGYLHDRKLVFREDASNAEPSCQRNVLRLKVLPILEDAFHPGVVETVARCAELMREEETYWEEAVGALWPTVCLQETASQVRLSIEPLRTSHPVLLRRLLRFGIERLQGHTLGIEAVHLKVLASWVDQGSSEQKTIHLPRHLRAVLEKTSLNFIKGGEPPPQCSTDFPSISIDGPGQYCYGPFRLQLSVVGRPPGAPSWPKGSDEVWMDADAIRWPMVVRSWHAGDRFHPIGMVGSKKLQDFFVDAGVPREERPCVPLLCDQEKICWIIGCRLDDRVKVTSRTCRLAIIRREVTE